MAGVSSKVKWPWTAAEKPSFTMSQVTYWTGLKDGHSNLYCRLDFLRNLPPLRPIAMKSLPAKTRHASKITLVLDLDETLVHSEHMNRSEFDEPVTVSGPEMVTVYMKRRPFLTEFLREVNTYFEVVLFTASQREYADELLKAIDPSRRLLRYRLYRDSCVFVNGVYVKDLSILGRDLSQVLIIDNSLFSFAYHLDNGILIRSWYDDQQDTVLLQLLRYLKTFILPAEDVRQILRTHFELFRLIERNQ